MNDMRGKGHYQNRTVFKCDIDLRDWRGQCKANIAKDG